MNESEKKIRNSSYVLKYFIHIFAVAEYLQVWLNNFWLGWFLGNSIENPENFGIVGISKLEFRKLELNLIESKTALLEAFHIDWKYLVPK